MHEELAELVIESLNEKGLWATFVKAARKPTKFHFRYEAAEQGVYVQNR